MNGEKIRTGSETISVIVPVYQVEPYLRACVNSILEQTDPDFEVILVDDGSTDGSGRICDEYARRDPRITVIHKSNGGLSSARNAGIEQAHGAYLAFADSDDVITPTMLEKLRRRIRETGAELALCSIQYVDEKGENIVSGDPAREYRLPEAVWTQEEFWEQKRRHPSPAFVVAWNKLYRRELFETLRYPEGKLHEDEFVLHRIIDSCRKIADCPEPLYLYRQREKSTMTAGVSERMLDKQEALLARAEYFCKKKNDKMVQVTVLEMIDFMEWFSYESELAGKPLSSRYQMLQRELIEWTCQPGLHFSVLCRTAVFLYRHEIFPYRFLRKMYGKWVSFRKKIRS